MTPAMRAEPKIIETFCSGSGVGWHEHDPGLFGIADRFLRPGRAVDRGSGAQAEEGRPLEAATEAGLTRFRRATGTAFNLVLEARP